MNFLGLSSLLKDSFPSKHCFSYIPQVLIYFHYCSTTNVLNSTVILLWPISYFRVCTLISKHTEIFQLSFIFIIYNLFTLSSDFNFLKLLRLAFWPSTWSNFINVLCVYSIVVGGQCSIHWLLAQIINCIVQIYYILRDIFFSPWSTTEGGVRPPILYICLFVFLVS